MHSINALLCRVPIALVLCGFFKVCWVDIMSNTLCCASLWKSADRECQALGIWGVRAGGWAGVSWAGCRQGSVCPVQEGLVAGNSCQWWLLWHRPVWPGLEGAGGSILLEQGTRWQNAEHTDFVMWIKQEFVTSWIFFFNWLLNRNVNSVS